MRQVDANISDRAQISDGYNSFSERFFEIFT